MSVLTIVLLFVGYPLVYLLGALSARLQSIADEFETDLWGILGGPRTACPTCHRPLGPSGPPRPPAPPARD
jgi:hypothetical protein